MAPKHPVSLGFSDENQPPPSRSGGRFRALFELGKLRIVELWIGFFVGVTLLDASALHAGRSLALLALILVAGIAVIAATCSLDDIVGVRDGVDQANHRDSTRWGVNKPILTGELSEGRAFRFVHGLAVVVAVCLAAIGVLAWPLPGWLLVLIPALMLIAVNYSYGLKLSYHGAGEAVILVGAAGTVLIPPALIQHTLSPQLLVEALLVGFWHAQVVVFSNTQDAAGDRATGRMTMAARTSERGNRRYIVGVFLVSLGLGVGGLIVGALPATYVWALAPIWGLQAWQLWTGVGARQWLRARRIGFAIIRVGVAALVLANLGLRP